uniref:Uncharacterized protein n=1 Tax=Anguilla anguilla TaxID=7936 RepID=A0A0E9QR46_ANGAN
MKMRLILLPSSCRGARPLPPLRALE